MVFGWAMYVFVLVDQKVKTKIIYNDVLLKACESKIENFRMPCFCVIKFPLIR